MENMQITLLTVGKLKEAYYRDAAQNYIKRLRHYATFDEIEVREERGSKNTQITDIVQKEGLRLLQALPPNALIIALDPIGKSCTSEALANQLTDLGIQRQSRLVCLIGGPFGLAPQILSRANWCLSLSPMTFPHELARVILLEQLYRAFTIIRGENYHK
jgi:23S rRNA (pseudouridine1915-N3)-methyltransferase